MPAKSWAAIVIVIVGAMLAVACSRPPDEERIRVAIADMQTALEEARPGDFMRHVSEDFTGSDGGVDREALHNLLRAQVLANERIGIVTGPLEFERTLDRMTVSVTATFTGGNARWLPERGAVYRVTSGWRETGGQWRCFNAQWERAF